MRLSYKGWLVFSQPLCLLVALSGSVVVAIATAPGSRLVRLGIDTLIANILVAVWCVLNSLMIVELSNVQFCCNAGHR